MRPITRPTTDEYPDFTDKVTKGLNAKKQYLQKNIITAAYAVARLRRLRPPFIFASVDEETPSIFKFPSKGDLQTQINFLTNEANKYWALFYHGDYDTQKRNAAYLKYIIPLQLELIKKYQKGISVDTLGTAYGKARDPLIDAFGNNCAYCDIHNQRLDVEHMLPKATFPSLYTNWSNFVLSCSFCNSAKNDEPSRGLLLDMDDLDPSQPTLSEAAFQTRGLADILWPEIHATPDYTAFDKALQFTFYRVEYDEDLNLINKKPFDPVGFLFRSEDPANAVMTLVPAASNGGIVTVRVGNATGNVELHLEALADNGNLTFLTEKTIELMNLNRTRAGSVAETPNDLRVSDRTRTFINAYTALRMLVYADSEAERERLFTIISDLISRGFWSVWWYFYNNYNPCMFTDRINAILYNLDQFPGTVRPPSMPVFVHDDGMNTTSADFMLLDD